MAPHVQEHRTAATSRFFKILIALKKEHESSYVSLAISKRPLGEPLPRRSRAYANVNRRVMTILREYAVRSLNILDHYLLPLSYSMPEPSWIDR